MSAGTRSAPALASVMFVHGLESSPKGVKCQYLRQHFDLTAEPMDTSPIIPLFKQYFTRRYLAKVLTPLAVGASMMGTLHHFHPQQLLGNGGLSALAAAAAYVGIAAYQKARPVGSLIELSRNTKIRNCFERALECQAAVLAATRPDVLVGSSFGGAVAYELCRRRLWNGPTVLLAPALSFSESGEAAGGLPEEFTGPLTLVHGSRDDVVSSTTTVRLYEACRSRGLPVVLLQPADVHPLNSLVATDQLRHIITDCIQRSPVGLQRAVPTSGWRATVAKPPANQPKDEQQPSLVQRLVAQQKALTDPFAQ
ncbi:hypothetical protein PAPYR_10929 [Paratrimastix pyriformis]|uniref:Uncharacterized protein n=1 Tax=Paratrimastix pyriformis TaxID=342808 RepID=A0ABQ8U7J3_9EUKA|nr:hypothetical protein PAPYR_10929 [Paratrimastix pyriformis]